MRGSSFNEYPTLPGSRAYGTLQELFCHQAVQSRRYPLKNLLLPALVLAAFAVSIFAQKQTTYYVKDSSGRTILETTNASIVHAMKNVCIESLDQGMISIHPTRNKTMIDALKDTIEKKIGRPTKAEYNHYWVEWQMKDSLKIVIIKPVSGKAVIFCNSEGLAWMKKNTGDILEQLK
jgi:hypothetical protein